MTHHQHSRTESRRPIHSESSEQSRKRRAYTAPAMTVHGSLEEITKGGVDPLPPQAWVS